MRHAADPNTVHNFRTKCLRELKKIKLAWPNLHYQTVKGALVLMPTHPAVAPASRRITPRTPVSGGEVALYVANTGANPIYLSAGGIRS